MSGEQHRTVKTTQHLPKWVYDVVIALQEWELVHPKLFADLYDAESKSFRMTKVDDCGCKAALLVPEDVRRHAAVLSAYLRDAAGAES